MSKQSIVTANRLGDGVVVYLAAGDRWSERLDEALVVADDAAKAALARAEAPEHATVVVGPYLMPVEAEAETGPHPASTREVIRARGPSVRLDLGKQAETEPRETAEPAV